MSLDQGSLFDRNWRLGQKKKKKKLTALLNLLIFDHLLADRSRNVCFDELFVCYRETQLHAASMILFYLKLVDYLEMPNFSKLNNGITRYFQPNYSVAGNFLSIKITSISLPSLFMCSLWIWLSGVTDRCLHVFKPFSSSNWDFIQKINYFIWNTLANEKKNSTRLCYDNNRLCCISIR